MAMYLCMPRYRRTSAMVLVVIVAVLTATTCAAPVQHGHRVGRPCSGRQLHAEPVELPAANDTDDRVSHHQVIRAVRRVRNVLAALYDDVNRLKTDYVSTDI